MSHQSLFCVEEGEHNYALYGIKQKDGQALGLVVGIDVRELLDIERT